MILLQGNQLSRSFAGDSLFENLTFSIQERSRIALIGRNGAGKSTLLKMIVGLEEPTTGTLSQQKNLTIGYLAQDAGLTSEQTIFDELLSVFADLRKIENELTRLTEQMADGGQQVLEAYDELSETFRVQGGFTYEADIKAILNGFQFPEAMWQQKISDLSGGQKTRLALAKMLLEKPQLLVLDEPTNHLDIETLAWLESYLKNYMGALLIVSHDRYFLDRVITETFELSRGQLTRFTGNYSAYIDQKAALLLSEGKAYDKQQKEIEKLEDFIAKNIVRASTTKRAQSRRKQLEKIDRLDAPLSTDKSVQLTFSPEKSSGNVVLTVTDATIGYDRPLARAITLDERKGEAIAIVGPNGIGKTTLIKSIIGSLPLLSGTIKLGANVTFGYYDQEQGRLTASNTVLEELWSEHRLLPEVEIRNTLGAFLFSGETVKKTVGMLSGGEKARLLLAKLAMNHDNFLLLDEPTNHLDIDSREMLEAALIDFTGTLLFVSHDRYFINRVADKVLEITPNGSQLYLGDYDYYVEKKSQESQTSAALDEASFSKPDEREDLKASQREKRRLERRVHELEEKLEEIDRQESEISAEMAARPNDYEFLDDWQRVLDRLETENAAFESELLDILESLETLETEGF